MTLAVEINPSGLGDVYITGLNQSFGHWGDREMYRWAFEREVNARPADLMVLRDDHEIVAGSAVSYRIVRFEGIESLVGVMTGSWTLPAARGRGAFSQVIDESRRLVASRGGDTLIAFVTQENASRRRLVAAGCLEVPTWYVASNEQTVGPIDAPSVRPSTATVDELFRAYRGWQESGAGASVVYRDSDVWAAQFLDRPLPVERLAVAGCQCLVEHAPASDRVLWIDGQDPAIALAGLLTRAVAMGRQLFVYTLQGELAEALVELGMVAKPGFLAILDADLGGDSLDASALPTRWRLQGGDRA